jgi:hypothetical protein
MFSGPIPKQCRFGVQTALTMILRYAPFGTVVANTRYKKPFRITMYWRTAGSTTGDNSTVARTARKDGKKLKVLQYTVVVHFTQTPICKLFGVA